MQTVEVSPQPISDNPLFKEIDDIMHQGIAEDVFPGAVLLVSQKGKVLYHKAFGVLSNEIENLTAKAQTSTVYDLAGLTGTLVTNTLMMQLIASGRVKLSDKVSRYLQGFSVHGKSPITIKNLLNQTSGLVPWHPYFEEILKANAGARRGIIASRVSKEYVLNGINRMTLKHKPDKRQEYSDLNFMVLGFIIEALTGMSLERAAQKLIFHPLGMRESGFIDLSMIRRRGVLPIGEVIAPTERCVWRDRIIHGEVHDDNSWAMGGISGHSGLFSTARDINKLTVELLKAYAGESEFIRTSVVRSFMTSGLDTDSSWALGWERPSESNGIDQTAVGEDAIGRSGFTGCSVWLEPIRGLDFILLSNRVHPVRTNKKILSFRPQLINSLLRVVD